MKKKIILTIGIILTIIASILIGTIAVNKIHLEANNEHNLKTYIYDPVNILDNKIESGNTYILPFIFESTGDRLKKSYIESEFAKANLTIKSISSSTIGTGTIIKTVEDNKDYQVLIYGDVDGDGRIGLADSQAIIDYYTSDTSENDLTGIYYTAANVNNDDTRVNLMDAQRIIDFYIEDIDTLLSNPPTDDVINGIEVITPNKLVYNYGEELDLTGAKVRRVTASGVKCIIEELPANCVTGYNKTKAGDQDLVVKYEGFTGKIVVRVLKPVTTLIINESCKTEDRSIGKQIVLGTIKQGEGESSFDIKDLKANVILSSEKTSAMTVSYKLRSEVFKDFTDENKNDVIILATAIKAGNYQVTAYIGENFEKATAKSTTSVMIEVTDTITINKIEIDGNVKIICKDNADNVDIPQDRIYKETKVVEGKTENIYYTLLPVKFKDQYGNEQSLEIEDFAGYDKSSAYKLTVSDNYGFEIPGLEVKTFRKDATGSIVIAGGENAFEYIGFASIHNVNPSQLENGIVTITYGPANLVNAVQSNIKVEVIK